MRRFSRKPLAGICLLCTLIVLALQALPFAIFRPLKNAELFAQDSLLRFFGRFATPSPELVYLAIDQASSRPDHLPPSEIEASPALTLMAQGFPWPRSVYPLILDRLFESGAKVVVIDLLFVSERDEDPSFRAALDRYRDRVIIGSNFNSGQRAKGETRSHVLPSESLIPFSTPLDDRVAYVNFWPDLDGIVRRAHFGVTVSEVFGDAPELGEEVIDSLAAATLRKGRYADRIPSGTSSQRIRFAGLPDTFIPRSACDIFDVKKWNSPEYGAGRFFQGKMVMLGPEGKFTHDLQPSPVGFIAGPELHLNAINAALQRDFLRETSERDDLALIMLAGLLSWALCFWLHGPLIRLGALISVTAGWLGSAIFLYSHSGLFIPMVAPLIALNSGGIGCLAWDFFLERRERVRVRSILNKYVAKNVAELVLAEGDAFAGALQGQRRTVTVIFTDIRGFTAMSEQAVPEEFIAQLNEYFYAMVEVVLAEAGTLQQFIGDAVLAVWGDTRTMDPATGAFHAVKTALLMRDALEKLNAEWANVPGRRQLEIGIGINQGEVIVGSVGHPLRMAFTVMGDSVNTAARLETATKQLGCGILVEESVQSLTRDRFNYRRVDWLRLKGKQKANAVFTVIGERSETIPPWLEEYDRAVDLYRARKFEDAGKIFAALSEAHPNDALCATYRERCADFEKAPPPDDWDGAYTMKEK